MRILILIIVSGNFLGMSVNNSFGEEVIKLWPDNPPGEMLDVGPEEDITKPTDRLIAGKRIIKLKNVAQPEVHVYLAPEKTRNGSAVVICPGGGFNILAWDLEGTEVAEWLNSIGVSAVVLKYRVPTSQQAEKWKAPVQDAQRAISLTRFHADDWGLKPEQIAILGFSAGGHTAARTALMPKRQYEAKDEIDKLSCQPDVTILVYPAWLVKEDGSLIDGLSVSEKTAPTFLVHAFDDRVSAMSSISLASEMKKKGASAELHLFESGGHGYGLRPVKGQPVTRWSGLCSDWLKRLGWIEK